MFVAYVAVTVLAAVANTCAAAVDFARAEWVLANMRTLGVPRTWLFPLGALKAAGALGLVVGIAVPAVGIAAATGLVAYFVGAMATVARARVYARLVDPGAFLALAVGALVLRLATA